MVEHLSRLQRIVLCLLMLALAACDDVVLGGADTPTPHIVESAPTALPLSPDASTAARIRTRGYLLVGVRYDDEPFGIVNDQGDLVGFDIDLAHEFAARWLGDPDAVEFLQVTSGSAAERVKMGQVDLIIGALPHTRDAAFDMNFSAPYYYDGLSLLVRTSRSISDTRVINGPADLADIPVGVVEGAGTEEPLTRSAGGAVPLVVYYPDYFSAVAGVANGVVSAAVGPARTLAYLASGYDGLGLTPCFTRDPYAIGVPKHDGPFRDLVNVTLMDVIRDGTYAALFEAWFPGKAPPDFEIWSGTSRLSFASLTDTLVPAPSTIQEIEARGFLIVGVVDDYIPFTDFDVNGVARGFEADLIRVMAHRWLGDAGKVQFVGHTEESGMAALTAGQIDMLAAYMPHTLPRDDEVDFSLTLYEGGVGLLVSAASGVSTLSDLNGGTIAAPLGGGVADAVQRAAALAGVVVSVQTVDDVEVALAGVADGTYRAYAGWRGDLLNYAYTRGGFLVLDVRLTSRPIALGLRQNDAAFRDLVDFTLQKLAVEGSFAALYDDWFGTDPPYPIQIWPGTAYRSLKLNPSPVAVPTAAP